MDIPGPASSRLWLYDGAEGPCGTWRELGFEPSKLLVRVRSPSPASTDSYVEYSETPDVPALKRLLSEDVRFSMPPQSGLWEGRDEVVQSWVDGGFGS